MNCYLNRLGSVEKPGFKIVNLNSLSECTELEKPGLYAWMIDPTNIKQSEDIVSFIKQSKLKAIAKGSLRLIYSGELVRDHLHGIESIDSNDNNDLLFSDVFFALGLPIYIGISINLKGRLETHREQLIKSIGIKRSLSKVIEFENENISVDDELESKYFGQRLALIWNDNFSLQNLYIKYVIPRKCEENKSCGKCGDKCKKETFESLRQIEYYANSMFNPVFGRR